jgi:hypothetical protein
MQPSLELLRREYGGWQPRPEYNRRMVDALGTVGMALLPGAFLANVAGRLRADGSAYQAMNAGGAGLLTWYSAQLGVWVFVILESVWTVAALWNLARAVTRARAS